MRGDRIVIVGGGLAGLRAAERLRERSFAGDITIVGAEHRPYNRPALSKQLLAGKKRSHDLVLSGVAELDARWRRAVSVTGLDPGRRVVQLPGKEEIAYDGLIIATGVEPRHLPGTPMHASNVASLRTMADGERLKRLLGRAYRVAIIGGGFIGCELASTLRSRARSVTLIDPAPRLMERALGPLLADTITEVHRANGVDVRSSNSVARWEVHADRVSALTLRDGTVIPTDLVIVAVGTMPSVAWLHGLDLDLSDGLLCGETCHVEGLSDVVAAGDVARWPNARFTLEARRVEHWIVAIEQARHAADSLLDGPAMARPFVPVPRFWSQQHGVRIQAVGMPYLGQTATVMTEAHDSRNVTVFTTGSRLMGAIALDAPGALIALSAMIEEQPLLCDRARHLDALAPPDPSTVLVAAASPVG